MGDGRVGSGDATAGQNAEHHSNWHKFWHDVENTGKTASQKAKQQLSKLSGEPQSRVDLTVNAAGRPGAQGRANADLHQQGTSIFSNPLQTNPDGAIVRRSPDDATVRPSPNDAIVPPSRSAYGHKSIGSSHPDLHAMGEQAKGLAKSGLDAVRGRSSNRTVNDVSNTAAPWVPGAGLLRQGANILNETGVEGKVLEGKKGPLKPPSERTMRDAGTHAIGSMIPVPGGGRLLSHLIQQSAAEKGMDAVVDLSKRRSAQPSADSRTVRKTGEPAAGTSSALGTSSAINGVSVFDYFGEQKKPDKKH